MPTFQGEAALLAEAYLTATEGKRTASAVFQTAVRTARQGLVSAVAALEADQIAPLRGTSLMEGEAFLTAAGDLYERDTFQGAAVLLGEAFLTASLAIDGKARLVGRAYVSAAETYFDVQQGEAALLGEAFLDAAETFFDRVERGANLVGNAYFGPVSFAVYSLVPASMHMEANAYFGPTDSEQYVPVVQGPLSGDDIDPSSQDSLLLTVAGTPVSLGCPPYWNLGNFRNSYDGKELSFSEIATPEIGFPTFDPEDLVTLDFDFTQTGSYFQRIFTGRIRNRTHVGENNNEAIEYQAQGFFQLANEITVLNTAGRPDLVFTVSSTLTDTTTQGAEVRDPVSIPIADAIQTVFSLMASRLGSVGIPATIGIPGLEQFDGHIQETVRLNNVGFTSGVQQLAAHQNGVKVYFDDVSQTWQFHNLLQAPTKIVNVCSVNVESLNFDISTEDRFTALTLFVNQEDEQDDSILYQEQLIDPGVQLQRAEVALRPLWLSELETTWNLLTANQPNPFTLESEYTWVYRRWIYDEDIDRLPGSPVRLRAKVKYWGGVERWIPIVGRVIESRRLVITHWHVFTRGDPYIPGDVVGPEAVTLTYYPRVGFFTDPASVTSITSEGSPVYHTFSLPQSALLSSVRWPTSGYEGTAFTQFGVERDMYQTVSREELTEDNARERLNLYKDVVVQGDVPIGGDPLEEFIHLNSQVRVQHATKKTGIESLSAILTEYIYTFGKRGLTTLSLTTDKGGLLNV